ncbi:MAG: hypothetical protein L0Z52_00360 [Acidobacteria bacterium]|nr:hypothetical protein [Acidobacteriota bacterium]
MPWTGIPLLLCMVAGWSLVSLRGREIRSGAFLIGDCPYYASATVSLWHDHDLNLENQLRGGLVVHERQLALGKGGEWYPKHPILMSLFSIPFYVAFGTAGFLLFNTLMMALLAVILWAICRLYVSPGTATAAVALVVGGSFLRAYLYDFSADVFSAMLVLGGVFLILKRGNFAGGLALGVSVLAKVTNLFISLLVLGLLFFRRPRMSVLAAGAGLLPGVALWMLLNFAMFGSPTTTGYDRTIVLQGGAMTTISHRGFFDLPLLEGILGQLLDPRVGILTTSPLLLLALPGLVPLFRRHRWDGLLFLGISEFLFLLFSTYHWWFTSRYGPRFLMVPVALTAVPMALALDGFRKTLLSAWDARGAALPASRSR